MKDCCDKWLMGLSPKKEQDGEFVEVHQCPTCRAQHKVVFRCDPLLGGDRICVVVGVD